MSDDAILGISKQIGILKEQKAGLEVEINLLQNTLNKLVEIRGGGKRRAYPKKVYRSKSAKKELHNLVWNVLTDEPQKTNDIAKQLEPDGLTKNQVYYAIQELCMKGMVEETTGNERTKLKWRRKHHAKKGQLKFKPGQKELVDGK